MEKSIAFRSRRILTPPLGGGAGWIRNSGVARSLPEGKRAQVFYFASKSASKARPLARELNASPCGLGDFHALGTKDLCEVYGRMDLELDLTPVVDHRSDVVVILRLEHDHVGSVAAERTEETHGFQTGRLCPLVPPLARFGDDIRFGREARPTLDERDIEHC